MANLDFIKLEKGTGMIAFVHPRDFNEATLAFQSINCLIAVFKGVY